MVIIKQEQEWGFIHKILIMSDTGKGTASVSISIDTTQPEPKLGYNNRAFIEGLWVDEAIRRKGYGSWLLDKAESRIREMGLDRVLIQCNRKPIETILFFAKRGYKKLFGREEYVVFMAKDFNDDERNGEQGRKD